MYSTILVPLDGSQRAEKILPHVEALAQQFASQLILLQVVEPIVAAISPYTSPYYDTELIERSTQEAKTYLAGLQSRLHEKGIKAKTCVEHNTIVCSILAVAEREKVDLIALASHGRTGLARVFYGSVAAGILNQAARPLLLVRAQA